MIRGLVFAMSAALVVGLAGCDEDTDSNVAAGGGGGGSTTTETASATSEHTPACDLLPQSELETLVGNALAPPFHNSAAEHVCMWDAPNFETDRSLTIQLSHGGAADYDATRAYSEEKFGATSDVSGIGDKAHYQFYVQEIAGFKAPVAQMVATQGKDLAAVTVGGPDLTAGTGEEVTRAILRQVLLKID